MHFAQSRGICLVPQDPSWFGFDPIHIRRGLYPRAALDILAPWRDTPCQSALPRQSWLRALYFATRVPYERQLLWIHQRRTQPCGLLRDGTSVSLY
jgi:hypothetical protein